MKRACRLFSSAGAAAVLFGLGACDNMQHQENVRAFEPSAHFADGAAARHPPAHTVARDDPDPNDPVESGRAHGQALVDFPIPLTRALLTRGRERFDIFCADCHGEDGYGKGIIVMRGFPQPASFHGEILRREPVGRLFDAVTRGYGVMYGFGDRIGPRDRWAIVAYIRALQKSQNASLAELSAAERRELPTP
jgi:mono/diheme cytochrome c family protein